MREWICPACQVSHNRDLNTSINILNNATVILTAA
ncbi:MULTISPECIES: zinc ribbon domain-containing protein [Psychrobacter]|nr:MULTISPECIES: zinc ribbon domain-containing protein [Psychrobacter]